MMMENIKMYNNIIPSFMGSIIGLICMYILLYFVLFYVPSHSIKE